MHTISILYVLSLVLDFFHIALMFFIMIGWIFRNLRKMHLIITLLTGISWLVFSHGTGIDKCILTDWHYHILRKMGEINLPETYAQYALKRFTGLTTSKNTALLITRSAWLLSLMFSITWPKSGIVELKNTIAYRLKI